VQAAAALQAERMRRALEARAVVAQVAEQKEADRAALAAVQVSMAVISMAVVSPFALSITDACIHPSNHLCLHSCNHAFILSFIQVNTIHVLQDQSTKAQ